MISRSTRLAVAAIAAFCVLAAPAAASSKTYWYLSLGDSLARGVQPDATGKSVTTNAGYPDVLYADMKQIVPHLRLKKLGCPGETSQSFIDGGVCARSASQLSAAKKWIHKHKRQIVLVTLDIGANDVAGCASGTTVDFQCVTNGVSALQKNIPGITRQLRKAAGSKTTMAGMTYYDPFLAAALQGPAGQQLATLSLPLIANVNSILSAAYTARKFEIADVAAAFQTTTTTPITVPVLGAVPTNTAFICKYTWMCAPAPIGPNIHANADGYALIADTFSKVAGVSKP